MRILIVAFLFIFSSNVSLAQMGTPALWRVADKDTTLHMLGTIHVLRPRTDWFNDELKQVIGSADGLFLELAPDQTNPDVMQPLLIQHGLLRLGQTLQDRLPQQTYEKLKTALLGLNIPEQSFVMFRPWFAGVNYANLRFVTLGYNPALGVDATLTRFAQTNGVPIEGLETADFQMSLFSSLNEEEETVFVEQIVNDDDDLVGVMNEMTNAWTAGDIAALDKLINDGNAEAPAVAEKIFFARNRNWVSDIQEILANRKGDYVLAVGAGHLVGTGSVIELLNSAGIQVSRVH